MNIEFLKLEADYHLKILQVELVFDHQIELLSQLNFASFFPVITIDAILANGIPVALETKGTVLLALGLTSIT